MATLANFNSTFTRDSRRPWGYRARTMIETDRQSEERGWETAKTLAEALPYIQVYDRETVVIKYGGHAMGESAVAKQFAADVVLLKPVPNKLKMSPTAWSG